jgi:hypothetical protein
MTRMLCFLILFLFSSHAISTDVPPESSLGTNIHEHITLANSHGFTFPWMNLALSRVPFYQELQSKYDTFFTNNVVGASHLNPHTPPQIKNDLQTEYESFLAQIRGTCPGQPSNSSTSFNLTIPRHKLEEFLTEDFLTDFPDFVQDRLQRLKVDQSDVTISEPFLKIFATDDGMEGFRVGHVVFKSSFDGTDFQILLRAASVKSSECRFDQQSRDSLTLKAKDLQAVLERKVVESRTFFETFTEGTSETAEQTADPNPTNIHRPRENDSNVNADDVLPIGVGREAESEVEQDLPEEILPSIVIGLLTFLCFSLMLTCQASSSNKNIGDLKERQEQLTAQSERQEKLILQSTAEKVALLLLCPSLSVCLSLSVSLSLSVCLSVSLSLCLSLCLSCMWI